MATPLTFPRCGAEARPPGLWSDTWSCSVHAAVAPLHPARSASDEALRQLATRAQVPVWLPWPLPTDWLLSGLQQAGDEHTGPLATVVACSGPNPLRLDGTSDSERTADLLLVAEQPGVGLGAYLAGLGGIDPGETIAEATPAWKVSAAGHDTPLWTVPVDGPAAFVGEAAGVWLWLLAWPQAAGVVLLEDFHLRDARDTGLLLLDMPFGALSPRLR